MLHECTWKKLTKMQGTQFSTISSCMRIFKSPALLKVLQYFDRSVSEAISTDKI